MSDWILNLPVLAMAAVILAATWLGTAVIYGVVTRLATGERAHTAVNREASSLRAVVLLAAAFPGEPEAKLRNSIGLAVVLLAAHSGPFSGAISVKPTVLQQVMPEAGAQ